MKVIPQVDYAICPMLGLVTRDYMNTKFELGPVTVQPLKMIDFKLYHVNFKYGKIIKKEQNPEENTTHPCS